MVSASEPTHDAEMANYMQEALELYNALRPKPLPTASAPQRSHGDDDAIHADAPTLQPARASAVDRPSDEQAEVVLRAHVLASTQASPPSEITICPPAQEETRANEGSESATLDDNMLGPYSCVLHVAGEVNVKNKLAYSQTKIAILYRELVLLRSHCILPLTQDGTVIDILKLRCKGSEQSNSTADTVYIPLVISNHIIDRVVHPPDIEDMVGLGGVAGLGTVTERVVNCQHKSV
jgi:hypothetical protein